MSPVVQPPLPLQLFSPLQSCLSTAALGAGAPALVGAFVVAFVADGFEFSSEALLQPVVAMVPASNPADGGDD